MMEVILTDDHFIFLLLQGRDTALWCSRHTGEFSLRPSWDLASEANPECLGTVMGLVGKIYLHASFDQQLVVIREADRLLELPESDVSGRYPIYRIRTVALIPITSQPFSLDAALKPCPKHHSGNVDYLENTTGGLATDSIGNKFPFKALGGKIKTAGNSIKTSAGSAAAGLLASSSQVVKAVPWRTRDQGKNLERLEHRLHEEILKMFNENCSFYFSYVGDLTNSLQRQYAWREEASACDPCQRDLPLWRRADDRFFFNRTMLQEIIDLEDTRADPWLLPIIQGNVEQRECHLSQTFVADMQLVESRLPTFYSLVIISRRSRHRAGTRYKRRGVEETGRVANYVETEQLLLYHSYALSFVQVRGSIPVYWSQPGLRYRPLPRIHRSDADNQAAFAAHFNEQFEVYGDSVNCISLVERAGREKILADTFLEHVLIYNRPRLAYVSFDFHEHCRGMRFENVALLIDTIDELIQRMGYFWADNHGRVLEQAGVFRVNCVDCLDRTNVVQTAIARRVLELQLAKLGLVQPEQGLAPEERAVFQAIWANNGDMISRQYAGTNALKGDYTRTGERNLSGLVKDGVNSASRYYLNHIRDTYRQAAIDILTAGGLSDDMFSQIASGEGRPLGAAGTAARVGSTAAQTLMSADQVRTVIEDCQRLLVPDINQVLGCWGLVDADETIGDHSQENMDSVLILSEDSCYVGQYDQDLDTIIDIQQVPLADITRIEFGQLVPPLSTTNNSNTFSLGFLSPGQRSKECQPSSPPHCVRIQYRSGVGSSDGQTTEIGYLTFRSSGYRFFNNMAVAVATEEERVESLKSVADAVAVAMEAAGLVPDMWFGHLERRQPQRSAAVGEPTPDSTASLLSDEGVVFSAVDPGSRQSGNRGRNATGVAAALSNVTSQISRFNPIGKLMRAPQQQSAAPEIRFTDLQADYSADQVDVETEYNAGGFSNQTMDQMAARYCPGSHPSINLTASDSRGDSTSGQLTTAELRRRRKISRSSENLSENSSNSHHIDRVLMPFAMLSQGLQSLGTNLVENKLSRSCEQFSGLEPEGGTTGSPFNSLDGRLLQGARSPACQSLVLNI